MFNPTVLGFLTFFARKSITTRGNALMCGQEFSLMPGKHCPDVQASILASSTPLHGLEPQLQNRFTKSAVAR
ncbi:hypothetical protein [Gulosibacter chungangensis]|uniref:Uncharacterized protein n=1 Tax=Gulosibacter chungangensis TaxID=979746 RepID=A0A7J5B7I6_9MICO|nr:hypothetical protein [Gulosibacter chungangensis]KAB1640961.1 hypothetical protein F8O05_13670 [Gulosibacter chungangensis]